MESEVLAVNFAFIVMKTMRFYGWSWEETLRTPISALWSCYKYVDRLRAYETLDRLPEQGYSMAEETDRKAFEESLQKRIGTVVVEKPKFDSEGWNKLKQISQR